MLPPAICIMGPTASGKTGLAVSLCEQFPLDIISVDSALVYRGMDIGTAKPDPATLARAPHRLINLREPSETYSAADFRKDALREMAEITAAGRVPLLVGGTMLYFRALLEGLAVLPAADQDIRERLSQRGQNEGWPALHAELAKIDPDAAKRIDPNDPQRIQRALEVFELTGKPLSELQSEHRAEQQSDAFGYEVLKIVVSPEDRSILHERIAMRFDQMMGEGFEEELRTLAARSDFDPALPAYRAVGYRQGWGWLTGEYDVEIMREKALAATRQLAKRQLTWLRRERDTLWYDPTKDTASSGTSRGVTDRIARFLESSHCRSQMKL